MKRRNTETAERERAGAGGGGGGEQTIRNHVGERSSAESRLRVERQEKHSNKPYAIIYHPHAVSLCEMCQGPIIIQNWFLILWQNRTFLGFCRRSADAGKVVLESGADPNTQAGLKCRNCANIFICMLHLVDLSICMQKKHESELRAQPYKLLSIKHRKVGNRGHKPALCYYHVTGTPIAFSRFSNVDG